LQIPFPAISFCSHNFDYHYYDLYVLHIQNLSQNPPKECSTDPQSMRCSEAFRSFKDSGYYYDLWTFLQIIWLGKFVLSHDVTFSSLDWCNTFNIVSHEKIYHSNTTASYFKFHNPPDMEALGIQIDFPRKRTKNHPLFTERSVEGFYGITYLSYGAFVVVHSPYETPDIRHRRISMQEPEFATLTIEPLIKITDETLLELDIDEYESSFDFFQLLLQLPFQTSLL